MTMNNLVKSVEFFDSMSVVIKLTLLFLLSVGNYRTILVFIIFFIAKAFIRHKVGQKLLIVLIIPAVIYTLLLDIRLGQLWLSHKYNTIIFIIMFIAIDHILSKYTNILAEKISNNCVFSYCSNCKYENNKLAVKCRNCGYDGNKQDVTTINHNNLYDNSFMYQLPKFKYILTSGVIANLSLAESEHIYMSMKVGFGDGPRIDGKKQLCSHIVITNLNVILMHKFLFQRGWRWREKISLNDVNEVVMVEQNLTSSARQSIKLNTILHTYELFLWTLFKQKNDFNNYFSVINQHIIKMQNIIRAQQALYSQ